MRSPRVTLDQWLAFKTVVDQGSYASAAEALNKSQSAISYAINRLNEQLPQPVLHLTGRKATLTEPGETLYRYAEQVLSQAYTAEAVATSLAKGFEAEVTIAVDGLFEVGGLTCCFEEFSRAFPHSRIRILETSLSGTTEALLDKRADLVIGPVIPVGYHGRPLQSIKMIPVASPGHPLVKDRQAVSEVELRGHRQVVLRDTGTRREQDAGWLGSEQRWTVSHFSTSIKLLKSGVVFGFLPVNWIREELDSGALKPIALQPNQDRTAPLYLMMSDTIAAGPATRALADLIAEKL